MAILFAANEEESFTPIGSPTFTTSSSFHDSTFADGAFVIDDFSGNDTLQADFADTADLWVHWNALLDNPSSDRITVFILQDDANPILRIRNNDPGGIFGNLDFQYWNGAAWITIAEDIVATDVLQPIDIHANLNASGEFTLYQNNMQIASFTGDTTLGATTANNIVFGPADSGVGDHYVSEVVVADEPTLNWRVQTLRATADGTHTEFTGTFADIDEVGLFDDLTFVTGDTNNFQESFVIEDSVTPGGYSVAALVTGARASRGSTGPQNMQFITVSNSNTFTSASVSGLDLGLRPYLNIEAVDPDTSLEWDDTSIAQAEVGVKAIT